MPTGRADVPARLEQLLQRSLKRDPGSRPASVAEFAHELQLVQYELGIAHTQLEVASEEWAAAGTPISFEDDRARGPVRSSVERERRRPERAKKSIAQTSATLAGTVIAGSRAARSPRTLTVRTALLLALGFAAIVAGGAVAIVMAVR